MFRSWLALLMIGGWSLLASFGFAQKPVKPDAPGKAESTSGFSSRAQRDKSLTKYEASLETRKSISRGLKWLATHQAPDGSWSLQKYGLQSRPERPPMRPVRREVSGQATSENEMAATSFALLPFLAAGITHKGISDPEFRKVDDVYCRNVSRGLSYLLARQKADGDLRGKMTSGAMYTHALATLVLCEAYGLTKDARIKQAAQSAVQFIINAQNPTQGGWRYTPRTDGDTSVTGFQIQALRAAQLAGLPVPAKTLKLAEQFLDSVAKPDGTFSYTPDGPTTPTMTTVGLYCRMTLQPKGPAPQAASALMRKLKPDKVKNLYHEYYCALVMFHLGGKDWEYWNKGEQGAKGFAEYLTESQDNDDSWYFPSDPWAQQGGRVMHTSLALLTLQTYYRHESLFGQ